MKRFAIAVSFLVLIACSGMVPVQPNYTLTNVDPQCVRGLILASLVDQGFVVRSTTDSQIVADRSALGSAGFLAPNEQRRVSILFIPQANDTMRVVVSEALVSNANSGFERSTPVYPGNGSYSMTGQNAQAQCARR
jgi:hypothetical protein